MKKTTFSNVHSPKEAHQDTRAVRTQLHKSKFCEHSTAMYLTSGYWFDDAETMRDAFADQTTNYPYSRYSNPNCDEFAAKIASLEGVEDGIATSSGMYAVYCSIMSSLQSGDHVLATGSLFGSTYQMLSKLLPRYGITTTFVDPVNSDNWQQSVQSNSKMFFVESPTNPGLQIIDLQAVSSLCKKMICL